MICTEFKTHADCIYVQNVFPSLHAPSVHTKHIHIDLHHFARMQNVCICHTILTSVQNVISVYAYMLLLSCILLNVFQLNMLTCMSLFWKHFCFHDITEYEIRTLM